jgi:hypothetical protein
LPTTNGEELIIFDGLKFIIALTYHLVDSRFCIMIDKASATQTVKRMQRKKYQAQVSRKHWGQLSDFSRTRWLWERLQEGGTLIDEADGVAYFVPYGKQDGETNK